jgi:hypothetical protein
MISVADPAGADPAVADPAVADLAVADLDAADLAVADFAVADFAEPDPAEPGPAVRTAIREKKQVVKNAFGMSVQQDTPLMVYAQAICLYGPCGLAARFHGLLAIGRPYQPFAIGRAWHLLATGRPYQLFAIRRVCRQRKGLFFHAAFGQ